MITSPSNPLVKELARLRDRRHRDRSGLFLVEGRRPLSLAIGAGTEVTRQIVCPELGGAALSEHIPTVEVGEAPFRKLSTRQRPDGLIGVARRLDTSLDRLRPTASSWLLVIEGVEKPGNLGAMLRTADAAGVSAVVACDPGTDVHNPNVVQASQGALFTMPVAVATPDEAVDWLTSRGFRVMVTSTEGGPPPWQCDLTGMVAVAIGSEATGLSPVMVAAASEVVHLPMAGQVDSLNASVSAAVLLYEAVRQRRG